MSDHKRKRGDSSHQRYENNNNYKNRRLNNNNRRRDSYGERRDGNYNRNSYGGGGGGSGGGGGCGGENYYGGRWMGVEKESFFSEEARLRRQARFGTISTPTTPTTPTKPTTPTTPTTTTTIETKTTPISSIASEMMKKMGYKEGEGLGVNRQGRREPISLKQRVSRAGLGKQAIEVETGSEIYEPASVSIEIDVDWISSPFLSTPSSPSTPSSSPSSPSSTSSVSPLSSFQNAVKKQKTVKMEPFENINTINSDWGEKGLQEELEELKTSFDNVNERAYRRARDRANPFEYLKGEMFQNRAALKLVELDRICDNIFTSPPCWNKDEEPLYFADICAGPGGFSEYMLYKHAWKAKGFGFTLAGEHDFKLYSFNRQAHSHSFVPFYGKDSSGDVTISDNLIQFTKLIKKETNKKYLHTVLCDGGFSVRGHENKQELLSQQIVFCQVALGLLCLRENGTFISKLFNTFLPPTLHSLYLLYLFFDDFSIVKPNQSRPANSEKYVVCKGFRGREVVGKEVRKWLIGVNDDFNNAKGKDEGVTSIFSIKLHPKFTDFMVNWNENNLRRQIRFLSRIHQYLRDPLLQSDNQYEIRKLCLKYWDLQHDEDPSSPTKKTWYIPKKTRTIHPSLLHPPSSLPSYFSSLSPSFSFSSSPPPSSSGVVHCKGKRGEEVRVNYLIGGGKDGNLLLNDEGIVLKTVQTCTPTAQGQLPPGTCLIVVHNPSPPSLPSLLYSSYTIVDWLSLPDSPFPPPLFSERRKMLLIFADSMRITYNNNYYSDAHSFSSLSRRGRSKYGVAGRSEVIDLVVGVDDGGSGDEGDQLTFYCMEGEEDKKLGYVVVSIPELS